MHNAKYSQTLFRSSLRVLDTAPEVSFSIRSGTAWSKDGVMYAKDEPASSQITRLLWEHSIFSERSLILSIGERLAQIGRRVNKSGWRFTGFLMQQHEHVEIRSDPFQVTDSRTWNMGRIVITTNAGKTGYRDVPLAVLQETELLDHCEAITEKILTELDRKATRRRIDIPTTPTVVVFAPGAGGYFIHEVFGHMLEGDFVSKGSSAIGKVVRLGERVGPSFLNIVDDPTEFKEHIGLNKVDDEGEPLTRISLVVNGILQAYLCDRSTHNP